MTPGISSLARSCESPQWFLLYSWKRKQTSFDFWLMVAFCKGEGGIFQNTSYICFGREGGIDGLLFHLLLLEWGFRAVASLIFWWWTQQGQWGVNWAPCLLHWAHSHAPPLPRQDTCTPWPPGPPPISQLTWPPLPHLFPLVSPLPQTLKPLSSSKWATTKTINTKWTHSKSSNSFPWRYVISTTKFLSLKMESIHPVLMTYLRPDM